MKRIALIFTGGLLVFVASSLAEQNVAQNYDILDEKIKHITTIVEDLQFRQKKLEDDLTAVKGDLETLRKAGGAVSPDDVRALQDRIAAVDTARKKDREAIINELSKELAAIGSGKPLTVKSGTATGGDYAVQKGDTLSSIAKANGCTVANLKKANNLTSDSLAVGQKLVVPK